MANLDDLLHTPPAELVADLRALREQRAGIEGKEAVLEQLLEILARQGGSIAAEIADLGASVAIGPLRSQILQVFRAKAEEGEAVMLPVQVHLELVERGNRSVKLDNVRVTMTRMASSKELERPLPQQLVFGLPEVVAAFPGGRAALEEMFGDDS